MSKRWSCGWVGMSGRQASRGGPVRVIKEGTGRKWTLEDVQRELAELREVYDQSNPEHRKRYWQLKERERQLRR